MEFNIHNKMYLLRIFSSTLTRAAIYISARQLSCTLVLFSVISIVYAFTYHQFLLLPKSPTFFCNLVYCAFLFRCFCHPRISKCPTSERWVQVLIFRLSRTFLLSSTASWTNNCIKIECTWNISKVNNIL